MNSGTKRRCDKPASTFLVYVKGCPGIKKTALVWLSRSKLVHRSYGVVHFSSSPKTACLSQNGQPHKAVSSPSLKVFKQKLSRNMVRKLERRFYTW